MARIILSSLLAILGLVTFANAQFGSFFDQMFQGNGGGGGHHHHQQQRQQPQNVPSDSNWYRENYGNGM